MYVKDEPFQWGKSQSTYKGSLWELKLPLGASNVENFKRDDENIYIYTNPTSEYVEINADINPTVNRRVNEGSEVKIFNTLGE